MSQTTHETDATQGGHHETVHLDNWWSFDYGPGKAHQNAPFGFALVNFTLLIILLVKLTRKPIGAALKDRHERVKKDLQDAAELKAQAQAQLAHVGQKLAQLDSEIAAIKAAVAQDAEAEKQQIIKNAMAEADRITQGAERMASEELKRVKKRLETEIVEKVLAATEQAIKQRLDHSAHERLETRFVTELSSVQGGQS